jgi:signal transduction histidine kinase
MQGRANEPAPNTSIRMNPSTSSRCEFPDGNTGSPDRPLPTFFAPAERGTQAQVSEEFAYIARDEVIAGLMQATKGLIAVVNEQRQLLALNDGLLRQLGLGDVQSQLGLRLGEAVGCVHAYEETGGCGTSRYCSTCGAAIAQTLSLAEDQAVERICAIDLTEPKGGADHLYMRVQVYPIRSGERRFLLLFLQDISEQQRAALLERTLAHDVNNLLSGVLGLGQLLADPDAPYAPKMANDMVLLTRRLAREIEVQQSIVKAKLDRVVAEPASVAVSWVLNEANRMCSYHPAAKEKQLEIVPAAADAGSFKTDATLLMRVLQNMVLNALEATPAGGAVRLEATASGDAIEFSVWNAAVIPPEIARRIFQRNFTTKNELGHGYGTYSMKLLGERMLGGSVTFTSQPGEGTCFRCRLPRGA